MKRWFSLLLTGALALALLVGCSGEGDPNGGVPQQPTGGEAPAEQPAVPSTTDNEDGETKN